MAVSALKAELSAEIERVWEIVTSFDGSWRSDLREIRKTDDTHFVEVDKKGYETRFTITAFEPFGLYELDVENENISGHWVGRFSSANGRTVIEFTEDITPKKAVMRLFVKGYLKKRQAAYLRDLERAVG